MNLIKNHSITTDTRNTQSYFLNNSSLNKSTNHLSNNQNVSQMVANIQLSENKEI
jgi:hypothetical protein